MSSDGWMAAIDAVAKGRTAEGGELRQLPDLGAQPKGLQLSSRDVMKSCPVD